VAKPTWEIFFGALAGVIVFVVPIVLYLMEKANKKISWIFIVGLISVGIAAVYLVLNIPWVWSASSTAWKVYRACMLSSFAMLPVGYFGIWVWPAEPQQKPLEGAVPSSAPQTSVTPDLAFSFRQIASNKTRAPLSGEGTTITIIGYLLNNGRMPTGVREWSLKIVPAGEQSELAGALVGGNFTTLSMRSDSGQEEVLSWKDDYLPEILA
jgi:hypothetical protein